MVTEVNIWIIIGSILGALLLLIIVVGILWKVSHYNYSKPSNFGTMEIVLHMCSAGFGGSFGCELDW